MQAKLKEYQSTSITTHERKTTIRLDKRQLEKVLTDWALKVEGVRAGLGVKVEISIESNTAGSPAYNDGHKATIRIVEDYSSQPIPSTPETHHAGE